MEASDVFLAARDYVAQGWHQGSRALDATGNCKSGDFIGSPLASEPRIEKYLDGWDPRAVSWCMMGSVEKALGCSIGSPLFRFINSHMTTLGYKGGIAFNDAYERTQNQVIGMLDDLAREAKEQHFVIEES